MCKQTATEESCVWRVWADEIETDIVTDCHVPMYEYDGDDLHWEVEDGDRCPFCGKKVRREWMW